MIWGEIKGKRCRGDSSEFYSQVRWNQGIRTRELSYSEMNIIEAETQKLKKPLDELLGINRNLGIGIELPHEVPM